MLKQLSKYLPFGVLLGNIVPRQAPDGDHMYNRRLLAYWSIGFTVYWSHLILAVYVFALYKAQASDAAIISAFLAVPGTIAGMNVWKYLRAAEKDDELKNGKPVGGPSVAISNSTVTVAPGPRDEGTGRSEGQTVQDGVSPEGRDTVQRQPSSGSGTSSGEGQAPSDVATS